MPSCSISHCNAKKGINSPLLTIHRFPKNKYLRRKWLEIIGAQNINPKHKELRACSIHFEESAFNRTLDVVRLRDNAVPKFHLETEPDAISSSDKPLPSTSKQLARHQQSRKLIKLKEIYIKQRKQIKRLNETVRRRAKKIAAMEDMIADLKKKVGLTKEQSILLAESAGFRDILKTKEEISKYKDLPLKTQYTEEIIKFALTLHLLSPISYECVRKFDNSFLPHPRTLTKWYQIPEY